MRTFILEWKPSISSYRMEDFNNDLAYIEYGEFNWSVHDWKQARSGDNFYMIKCSEGCTGIVMKGFFTSDPYEADDWSGRNREVHYMDFRPTFMIHPDKCSLLSTAELEKAMPGFQWNGGHSGRLLPEEMRPVLDGMWDSYVGSLDPALFNSECAARNDIPAAIVDDAVKWASNMLYEWKDRFGGPLILHNLKVGLAGMSDQEKICGFLLDAIRNPDCSAGILREEGFSEEIADILLCISQPEGVSLKDHAAIIAASGSDTAKRVLRNHLDILLSEAEEHADKAFEEEVRQALTIVQI